MYSTARQLTAQLANAAQGSARVKKCNGGSCGGKRRARRRVSPRQRTPAELGPAASVRHWRDVLPQHVHAARRRRCQQGNCECKRRIVLGVGTANAGVAQVERAIPGTRVENQRTVSAECCECEN